MQAVELRGMNSEYADRSMNQKKWDIRIWPASGKLYSVEVQHDNGRAYRFETELPPDISDVWKDSENRQSSRAIGSIAGVPNPLQAFKLVADFDTLRSAGQRLLQSLFNSTKDNESRELLGSFKTLANMDDGLLIAIDLTETPELSEVPWEALCLQLGEGDSQYRLLGATVGSNIVRKISSGNNALPPSAELPVRILVVVANPLGDLETDRELADINKQIQKLGADDSKMFKVDELRDASRQSLFDKIEEVQPHVIHFIGHGGYEDDTGVLYLHDEENSAKADPLTSTEFRDLITNDPPWLVVLNSCEGGVTREVDPFAGVAQNLVRNSVSPFVVAMQNPITDDAAITFSRAFYRSLSKRWMVPEAVTRGRNSIMAAGKGDAKLELMTPVLYTSNQTDRIAVATGSVAPVIGATLTTSPWYKKPLFAGTMVSAGVVVTAFLALQLNFFPTPAPKSGGVSTTAPDSTTPSAISAQPFAGGSPSSTATVETAPPSDINQPPISVVSISQQTSIEDSLNPLQLEVFNQQKKLFEFWKTGRSETPPPQPPIEADQFFVGASDADLVRQLLKLNAWRDKHRPTGYFEAPRSNNCFENPEFSHHILFEWDQSKISEAAIVTLNKVIDHFRENSVCAVQLTGQTDTSGSASYNLELAQHRISAVRAYLESKDLFAGYLYTEARGESQPYIATADNIREPQNRRVTITYDPKCANLGMNLAELGSINFVAGSTEIIPANFDALREAASFIPAEKRQLIRIKLVGHANSAGSWNENVQLSRDRLEKAVHFLKNDLGLDINEIDQEPLGAECAQLVELNKDGSNISAFFDAKIRSERVAIYIQYPPVDEQQSMEVETPDDVY